MITETLTKSISPIAETISEYDSIIFRLKAQIKEQQEKKRELKRQQLRIEKLIKTAASLEIDWNEETIEYVWQNLASVLPIKKSEVRSQKSEIEEKNEINLNEIEPLESDLNPEVETISSAIEPIEGEELIKNPAKKNTSNSFFAWQPTSNEAIATYFNLQSGRTQAAYFAANNKQRLAEIETKLMGWFPGVSCSKRVAQRLTKYKYELKVVGWNRVPLFDDSDFGWLTQIYDPLQPLRPFVKDYLCCRLEDNPALEIEF